MRLTGGFAFLLMIAVRPGHSEMSSPLSARIEMIWSAPITTEIKPDGTFGESQGLVLDAGAAAPDGTAVFLGRTVGGPRPGPVLLRDAERAGPDAAVRLDLPTPDTAGDQFTDSWFFTRQRPNRNPTVSSFAVGAAGETWLGGFSNAYMGIASDSNSDAYLAKIDATGTLRLERSYRIGVQPVIESIAAAAAGGTVLVGRDMGTSWLAEVADDGTLLRKHRFGNGKGAAVARLSGGRYLAAGFDGEGQAATYQDNVSTWVLDDAGALRGPNRVRDALNGWSGSYFGQVAVSAVSDGAYVVSNWSDPSRPRDVEVARVGPNGALLWRRNLPDTLAARKLRPTDLETCEPALATLAGGDALVACALGGLIQLYRFDSDTGEQRAARLPVPDCQREHPAALFLVVLRDGAVVLAGSRPGSNVAASCSWLARLIL